MVSFSVTLDVVGDAHLNFLRGVLLYEMARFDLLTNQTQYKDKFEEVFNTINQTNLTK